MLGFPDRPRVVTMISMMSALGFVASTTLILGGLLVDGTGSNPRRADVRLAGDRIVSVGNLQPRAGETVVKANGLVVAPGFIDAHSHADGGIAKEPRATSQIMQGITTAVVGQDGIWAKPVREQMLQLASEQPALNFALFSGHGGIRRKVMGADFKRAATQEEIAKMAALVDADMQAGAIGLSTGLEYDPGYYATTDELVALSKVAARRHGMYISHMRDEANASISAIDELIRIASTAHLPAQISHIKLCSKAVWGLAGDVCAMFGKAKPALTADVYPYTFWQSTISALTPSREWDKRGIWEAALRDVGGPSNVRLTAYTHEPKWVGKTLAEIAAETSRDPIDLIQEILKRTRGEGGSGDESVAVTAMSESDLETFIRHPRIMFSSDGSIGGTHPRSAGSFPRVLARYVRERKTISLAEAIRKMTSLPADTFGFRDRGRIAPGTIADLVVFDPKTIVDRATAAEPELDSIGIRSVYVSGVAVVVNGRVTGARPGRIVRRQNLDKR